MYAPVAMMRRGDGRHLLAPLAVGVLLFSACSSGDDTAADEPTPEPTAVIEDAPTATPAPEPTATPQPEPTATPEPQPTEPAEESVEEQVIAAWERYLDLSIQARGKEPSEEAMAHEMFVGGAALERLEEVLRQQAADAEYVRGAAVSKAPEFDFENDASVLVSDCINVSLERVDAETDVVKSSQVDDRGSRARMELIGGAWVVTGIETGPTCD